ncbi:hypothetical protein KC316_g3512, partial [Hortaea werneckii]
MVGQSELQQFEEGSRQSHRILHVLVPASRLFAAHWSLFLPDLNLGDPKEGFSTGTRIHVVGDRLNGFRLEVVRGYDCQKDRSLQGRIFAVGNVPQQYLQPCEASSENVQDGQLKDADEGGGIISEEIRTPFETACSQVEAPGSSLNRVSQQETAGERPGRRPKPEVKDCQCVHFVIYYAAVEGLILTYHDISSHPCGLRFLFALGSGDEMAHITVDVCELPKRSSEDFRGANNVDANPKTLPAPCEERVQAMHQQAVPIGQNPADAFRPAPVCFLQDDLLVKWGADVTIAEGQCLWFLNQHLDNKVPVPRIYGWTQDQGQTFLYMQLIHGDPLSKRWDNLSSDEKLSISEQLKPMVATWQSLRRPDRLASDQPVLSQLGGQTLRDIMFFDGANYPAGPFESVREFNDAFARLALRTAAVDGIDPRKTLVELRGLTDDMPAVFAHADLDLSNILISKLGEGPVQVKAIIDWHQAGWYPKYW